MEKNGEARMSDLSQVCISGGMRMPYRYDSRIRRKTDHAYHRHRHHHPHPHPLRLRLRVQERKAQAPHPLARKAGGDEEALRQDPRPRGRARPHHPLRTRHPGDHRRGGGGTAPRAGCTGRGARSRAGVRGNRHSAGRSCLSRHPDGRA